MAVVVRAAEEEDFPAIQAIYAHHVLTGFASFEETPPDVAELKRRWQAIVGEGLPYLVATVDGALLGYAYAGRYRARSAYRFSVEDSVYVALDAGGRGIGRTLLDTLIARCTEAGRRQMIAIIGDSGNTASIALHRACGFTLVGAFRDVGLKRGRWVDTVLMQRALGPGGSTLPA